MVAATPPKHNGIVEKGASDYYHLIKEDLGDIEEGMVIISNLVKDSMHLETSYREMQILHI